MRGDFAGQRSLAQESAAIFQEAGQLQEAGRALARTGRRGDTSRECGRGSSAPRAERGIAREHGDQWGLAFALGQLGAVAYQEADLAAARGFREEAASVARAIGDRHTLGLALAGLALVARIQGNHDESAKLFDETLLVSSELEDQWVMPRALGGLAGAAVLAANYERAARLFGATAAMRDVSGMGEAARSFRAAYERDEAEARTALGTRHSQRRGPRPSDEHGAGRCLCARRPERGLITGPARCHQPSMPGHRGRQRPSTV